MVLAFLNFVTKLLKRDDVLDGWNCFKQWLEVKLFPNIEYNNVINIWSCSLHLNFFNLSVYINIYCQCKKIFGFLLCITYN